MLAASPSASPSMTWHIHPGRLLSTRVTPEDTERARQRLTRELFEATLAAVPEPTTMLLFGTGIAGIAANVRRRKK